MRTNYSSLFYLKKQKNYEKGPEPIYMRITVAGKRAEAATGRDCKPSRWNVSSGRMSGIKEDVKTLNSYLDGLQAQLLQAHTELSQTGQLITAEIPKNCSHGQPIPQSPIYPMVSGFKFSPKPYFRSPNCFPSKCIA